MYISICFNCFHWLLVLGKSYRLKSSNRKCSVKKGVLINFAKFSGKHLCQRLFIKKESLAQVFSCQFCKIYKSTFFTEHLRTTAVRNTMPIFKGAGMFDEVMSNGLNLSFNY